MTIVVCQLKKRLETRDALATSAKSQTFLELSGLARLNVLPDPRFFEPTSRHNVERENMTRNLGTCFMRSDVREHLMW